MNESSKAHSRRLREGYFDSVFVGVGIDIGCGTDPVTPECERWDLEQGDAEVLAGIAAATYDWVYSSHCLEHILNPGLALSRWWEVLKPGGKMLIVVPDEDLYEQGCWPSRFNGSHRWTFTIFKASSWSPVSISLEHLVQILPDHQVLSLRVIDDGYDHSGGIWDRTLGEAEANIELLVKKSSPD